MSHTASKTDFTRTKKFVHSNPIPLDIDSDPDFNPGPYVYEPPKRGRKAGGKSASAGSRGKKRRIDTLDDIEEWKGLRKSGTKPRKVSDSQNTLKEYFHDLGLQSASEDENDADIEEEEPEEDDEDESDEHQSEKGEQPIVLKTFAVLAKQSRPGSQGDTKPAEESVTESETEPETAPEDSSPTALAHSGLMRKSIASNLPTPPSKKVKLDDPDDSVTEPETDPEAPLVTAITSGTRSPQPGPTTASTGNSVSPTGATAEESVTESETEPESETELDTDAEELASSRLQARPTFPLKPNQPLLGPLVLDKKHKVPARINTFLREYQRDGVRFFWERYKEGRGGLLGDDMGLVSKTIQVISFLSAMMQKHGDTRDIDRRRGHVSRLQDISRDWKERRVLPPANHMWPTCLIIAPSSVVGNWEREFQVWGYFEVGMYVGAPSERANVLRDFKLGRLDVVLTSFDVARRDIELLDDMAWSCIIVDEVHRVKNPRSKLTAAFSQFECAVRFGLTGTAIQNSYMELWTILNWTNPGRVGTKGQWEGYVVRPLTVGQSKTAKDEEHIKAALVAKILKEKLLPKFFLRGTKHIIAEQLPKKIDEVVFCPLTSKQIEVYKRILNTDAVQNMIRKDEPCDCGSRLKRGKCCHPFDKGDLFKYMSTLIKISNHLALILPSPTDTPEQTARNRELSRAAFPDEAIPKYGPAMLVPRFCGKWMVLGTLLREWRKDPSNKVLIFTKSVKLLEMLEFHLRSQNLGFVKLDGSTKQSDRMPLIDKFHEDPDIFVFLISTLAGGTGLNLTGANKVVIFDPNWNPAHDLQAMDRAYRFGQLRDVSVYRLLGAGSIEELVYARQVYKQQQMLVGYNASFQTRYFEGVQGEKGKQGELFGIKNIFKLHEDTLATKMAIERAVLTDLDWALAHVDAKAKRASSGAPPPEVIEAKINKDVGDLRGLEALLFDDNVPKIDSKANDLRKTLQKTLNDIGVNYTHRNEFLIAESTIEGRRVQTMLEEKKKVVRRTRKAKAQGMDSSQIKRASPEPEWPPKRRHHKAPPSPMARLSARREALIELGLIQHPDHAAVFAQEFRRKSPAEQNEILIKLDDHEKRKRLKKPA